MRTDAGADGPLLQDGTISTGCIRSSDRAVIGFTRLGSGPPLVVCHGSFSHANEWLAFAGEMAHRRTVFLYDRRGRGRSDAPSSFATSAEVNDLAAMVAMAGPNAAVLGHSFGGGCALSFAARGTFDGSLVLYEPRHSAHGAMSRGQIPAIRALLARNDVDGAIAHALEHVVGLPSVAVEAARATPLWSTMRDTIAAFPNELRLLDSLTWVPGDLDMIRGDVWLLIGENSRSPVAGPSPDAALQRCLPRIERVVLPGQGHFAYSAAPVMLSEMVENCLTA